MSDGSAWNDSGGEDECSPEKLEIICKELDKNLDETSKKIHLTTVNVKSIIHQVITNKDVQTIFRNQLKKGELKQQLLEAIFEPKMTRSKLKEAMKSGKMPRPWGIVPSTQEATLLDMNFEEDEEDEEYAPTIEELNHNSEDEESSSRTSESESPRVSKSACDHSRFPAGNGLKDSTTFGDSLNQEMSPPARAVPVKKLWLQKERLESNKMALRTRSKLPLTNTSISELESMIADPDVQMDFVSQSPSSENRDWQEFLSGLVDDDFFNSFDQNDDEGSDPNYNFVEDEGKEEEDAEERRFDKGVQISKKEMKNLFDELLDALGYGDMERLDCLSHLSAIAEEKAENVDKEDNDGLSLQQSQSESQPIATEDEYPIHIPKLKSGPEIFAMITGVWGTQGVMNGLSNAADQVLPPLSEEEQIQLRVQMAQHVQLLAQTYVCSTHQTSFKTPNCSWVSKQLLLELWEFKKQFSVMSSNSFFDAYNLEAAVEVTKMTFADDDNDKNKQRLELNYNQMDAIANSRAFLFPSLLPKYKIEMEFEKDFKYFLKSEDALLAMGLDQFGHLPNKFSFIKKLLLPTKSEQQMILRMRNLKRGRSQGKNPVKYFYDNKILPMFPRNLNILKLNDVIPPNSRSLSKLPNWFHHYNKEKNLRFPRLQESTPKTLHSSPKQNLLSNMIQSANTPNPPVSCAPGTVVLIQLVEQPHTNALATTTGNSLNTPTVVNTCKLPIPSSTVRTAPILKIADASSKNTAGTLGKDRKNKVRSKVSRAPGPINIQILPILAFQNVPSATKIDTVTVGTLCTDVPNTLTVQGNSSIIREVVDFGTNTQLLHTSGLSAVGNSLQQSSTDQNAVVPAENFKGSTVQDSTCISATNRLSLDDNQLTPSSRENFNNDLLVTTPSGMTLTLKSVRDAQEPCVILSHEQLRKMGITINGVAADMSRPDKVVEAPKEVDPRPATSGISRAKESSDLQTSDETCESYGDLLGSPLRSARSHELIGDDNASDGNAMKELQFFKKASSLHVLDDANIDGDGPHNIEDFVSSRELTMIVNKTLDSDNSLCKLTDSQLVDIFGITPCKATTEKSVESISESVTNTQNTCVGSSVASLGSCVRNLFHKSPQKDKGEGISVSCALDYFLSENFISSTPLTKSSTISNHMPPGEDLSNATVASNSFSLSEFLDINCNSQSIGMENPDLSGGVASEVVKFPNDLSRINDCDGDAACDGNLNANLLTDEVENLDPRLLVDASNGPAPDVLDPNSKLCTPKKFSVNEYEIIKKLASPATPAGIATPTSRKELSPTSKRLSLQAIDQLVKMVVPTKPPLAISVVNVCQSAGSLKSRQDCLGNLQPPSKVAPAQKRSPAFRPKLLNLCSLDGANDSKDGQNSKPSSRPQLKPIAPKLILTPALTGAESKNKKCLGRHKRRLNVSRPQRLVSIKPKLLEVEESRTGEDVESTAVKNSISKDSLSKSAPATNSDRVPRLFQESADEDAAIAELMSASTTIDFNKMATAQLMERQKALRLKERKDMMISLLDEKLLESDPMRKRREMLYAESYVSRVKERFKDNPERFVRFNSILFQFSNSFSGSVTEQQSVKQHRSLYEELKDLFCDHQDLLSDFSGFLPLDQAVALGCFISSLEFEKARIFMTKLETYFKKRPQTFHRCLKMLKECRDGLVSEEDMKHFVTKQIKHNSYLLNEFSWFFPDDRPQPSQKDHYEEVDLCSGEEIISLSATDKFEKVKLPVACQGTISCTCLCHVTSSEVITKKSRHCSLCSHKVTKGKCQVQSEDKAGKCIEPSWSEGSLRSASDASRERSHVCDEKANSPSRNSANAPSSVGASRSRNKASSCEPHHPKRTKEKKPSSAARQEPLEAIQTQAKNAQGLETTGSECQETNKQSKEKKRFLSPPKIVLSKSVIDDAIGKTQQMKVSKKKQVAVLPDAVGQKKSLGARRSKEVKCEQDNCKAKSAGLKRKRHLSSASESDECGTLAKKAKRLHEVALEGTTDEANSCTQHDRQAANKKPLASMISVASRERIFELDQHDLQEARHDLNNLIRNAERKGCLTSGSNSEMDCCASSKADIRSNDVNVEGPTNKTGIQPKVAKNKTSTVKIDAVSQKRGSGINKSEKPADRLDCNSDKIKLYTKRKRHLTTTSESDVEVVEVFELTNKMRSNDEMFCDTNNREAVGPQQLSEVVEITQWLNVTSGQEIDEVESQECGHAYKSDLQIEAAIKKSQHNSASENDVEIVTGLHAMDKVYHQIHDDETNVMPQTVVRDNANENVDGTSCGYGFMRGTETSSNSDRNLWLRSEDRAVLEACKLSGVSESTFKALAHSLTGRTINDVRQRFEFLMDLYSTMDANDDSV